MRCIFNPDARFFLLFCIIIMFFFLLYFNAATEVHATPTALHMQTFMMTTTAAAFRCGHKGSPTAFVMPPAPSSPAPATRCGMCGPLVECSPGCIMGCLMKLLVGIITFFLSFVCCCCCWEATDMRWTPSLTLTQSLSLSHSLAFCLCWALP